MLTLILVGPQSADEDEGEHVVGRNVSGVALWNRSQQHDQDQVNQRSPESDFPQGHRQPEHLVHTASPLSVSQTKRSDGRGVPSDGETAAVRMDDEAIGSSDE